MDWNIVPSPLDTRKIEHLSGIQVQMQKQKLVVGGVTNNEQIKSLEASTAHIADDVVVKRVGQQPQTLESRPKQEH